MWSSEEYDLDDDDFVQQMRDDGWDEEDIAEVMGNNSADDDLIQGLIDDGCTPEDIMDALEFFS
jgi:uncharacterized protein Smg (DUF494 family)